jgi:hypothetical protein
VEAERVLEQLEQGVAEQSSSLIGDQDGRAELARDVESP